MKKLNKEDVKVEIKYTYESDEVKNILAIKLSELKSSKFFLLL